MPIRMAQIQKTDNTSADEGVKHRNSHSFLMGTQKGMTALEGSLEIYKTKHTLIIYPPCYLPKGTEDLFPHKKKLHTAVYNQFIIFKSWKQPICTSFGEQIDKL